VRHAVGRFFASREPFLWEELETWWAAHVAAPLVGSTFREALAATLSCANEDEAPNPGRLPSPARTAELAALISVLKEYRH
jgi:hypothetical protein